TGLAREDAELALKVCLADYAGHLDVLDSGDIVYRFDARLAERDRDPLRVRLWRGLKRAGMLVMKIGIMVTLVGYAVLFAVLALSAILGLFSKSDNDVDEDWLALAWLPLRALLEVMIFFPDWFFWGMPSARPRRLARGGKPPLHEAIFAFAFGPRRPPAGLAERDRAGATLIRHFRGVLSTADVVASTGVSRYEADEWLGRLLGRFGGDVDVTESGEILYRFGDLTRSAAAARRPEAPPLQRPLPLTGNSVGTNALIAGLSAIVLAGATAFAVAMTRFGIDLPAASWGLVYIPGFVGTMLLALPPLRSLALARENRQLLQRNLRRLTLATTASHAGMLDPTALRHILPESLERQATRGDAIPAAVRSLAAEFDGDPVDEPAGAFHAPDIAAATRAAERARETLRLDKPVDGPVVYTTAEEAEEA
ncbi:MAG TPA: hypothetical protein VF832_10200, partial [Longimicrobiales bacterium]